MIDAATSQFKFIKHDVCYLLALVVIHLMRLKPYFVYLLDGAVQFSLN